MNAIYIVDTGQGRVQIRWRQDGDEPRVATRSFHSPFGSSERHALRWYLESYLAYPYGAELDRARGVAERMAQWGEVLFTQVFGASEVDAVGTLYEEAVRDGLGRWETCIQSEASAFLSVPWELLRDPAPGRGYLVESLRGLRRQLADSSTSEAPDRVRGRSADDPFRILLVIARPYGERDVQLGTVAQPVIEALRPLRSRIDVEVLRPPTFDALKQRVADRPDSYDLLHFDGHGTFVRPEDITNSTASDRMPAAQGYLVFERDDGGEELVSAGELARALQPGSPRLFVLNACQSAEVSEQSADPFGSVAAALVGAGASGAVAMSYSVGADAAAMFMGRFYERLVRHGSLSEAVADGRRRLLIEPYRQSIVGPLELRDWLVPTLLQRGEVLVPIPGPSDTEAPRPPTEETNEQQVDASAPTGPFGFVGRDYDLLRIERAFRQSARPWALLTAPGGVGKTELAYGFARWYAATGGCRGGVFVAHLREQASLAHVLSSVVGYGADVAQLPEQELADRVVAYLRREDCLLVWDGLEPVAGYPRGAAALASAEERAKIATFAQALRGGASRLLITSLNADEPWLGVDYIRLEVPPLVLRDAGSLARVVLSSAGRSPEEFRDDPDYARLIRLLGGHPRAIQVALPLLRRHSPREVIDALQYRVGTFGEAIEDASITHAFASLSPRCQGHLPLVGLFTSNVRVRVLNLFATPDYANQDTYSTMAGEVPSAVEWQGILHEAAGAGLLTALGDDAFKIPPTLPRVLLGKLAERHGDHNMALLNSQFFLFYVSLASRFETAAAGADPVALRVLIEEEPNFLRALYLVTSIKQWTRALPIARCLANFYRVSGRGREWAALRASIDAWMAREWPDAKDRARTELGLFLAADGARDAVDRHDPDAAASVYRGLLAVLEEGDGESRDDARRRDQNRAVIYHELGMVAQQRNLYDEAETSYRLALAINEHLGSQESAAHSLHQLGVLLQLRARFDEAERVLRDAVAIRESMGKEVELATDFVELGMTAHSRGRLDEAETWYRKSLEINERLGIDSETARDYHQLGVLAEDRGRHDEAEQWHRLSLAIYERFDNPFDIGAAYHQLGLLNIARDQYAEAEAWLRRALSKFEAVNNEQVAVQTCSALGVLCLASGRFQESMELLGRAYLVSMEHDMAFSSEAREELALLRDEMGRESFFASWNATFVGKEPPSETTGSVAT